MSGPPSFLLPAALGSQMALTMCRCTQKACHDTFRLRAGSEKHGSQTALDLFLPGTSKAPLEGMTAEITHFRPCMLEACSTHTRAAHIDCAVCAGSRWLHQPVIKRTSRWTVTALKQGPSQWTMGLLGPRGPNATHREGNASVGHATGRIKSMC